MADDWNDLLTMPAEQAIKPPPIPKGTYRGYIESQEQVKSRDKGTPGIQFNFTKLDPQADVNAEQWREYLDHPAIAGAEPKLSDTFWLSRKAMYRLRDFCEIAGAKPDGMMAKMVSDAVGSLVLLTINNKVASDGETVYAEIGGYAIVE
jgi:hypothetical protein